MKIRCKISCVITSAIKDRIASKSIFSEIDGGWLPVIDEDIGTNWPIITHVVKRLITINGIQSIMVEKRLFGSFITVH